jgi:hypothetical protein
MIVRQQRDSCCLCEVTPLCDIATGVHIGDTEVVAVPSGSARTAPWSLTP